MAGSPPAWQLWFQLPAAMIRVYLRQLAAPHILQQKTCDVSAGSCCINSCTNLTDDAFGCADAVSWRFFALFGSRFLVLKGALRTLLLRIMGCNSSTTKGHVPSSAVTHLTCHPGRHDASRHEEKRKRRKNSLRFRDLDISPHVLTYLGANSFKKDTAEGAGC
eukprot:Skav211586  [mRNA]  locus=scaffold393:38854:40675:+ [translate_table: standard]